MIALEVIGNIGSDAVIKDFNGQKYIAFSLASTERYKDQQGNKHERTTWVSCLKPGESDVVNFLKKGTQVFVRGDFSAKTFNSGNGVQIGLNCRVRELQLLGGAKPNDAQAAQPEVTPQNYPPSADVPSFPEEGAKDDLPF